MDDLIDPSLRSIDAPEGSIDVPSTSIDAPDASHTSNTPSTPFSFDNYDLPPKKLYNGWEEAVDDMNDWAGERGYAFTKERMQKKPNGRIRCAISCDRREEPKEDSENCE